MRTAYLPIRAQIDACPNITVMQRSGNTPGRMLQILFKSKAYNATYARPQFNMTPRMGGTTHHSATLSLPERDEGNRAHSKVSTVEDSASQLF